MSGGLRRSWRVAVLETACRIVGCRSLLARWFEWPHREVCSRLAAWAARQ